MTNPNGPYPGRQLFVGISPGGRPAVAYLVTGRSAASRERRAIALEDGVRIGPLGDVEYDPLRHYTALKVEPALGLAVVSNGIQTEAIFEAYRLLGNVGATPDGSFLQKLLEGAGAEPDSLKTPRIAGVITRHGESGRLFYFLGVKRADMPARALSVAVEPGVLFGVSTYQGDLSDPRPFDLSGGPARLPFEDEDPHELATRLYDISAASHQDQDIRVCTVAAMPSADDPGAWDVAIKNRQEPPR